MKRAYKRITAILLAALMLATTVPEQVLAQEAEPVVVQEMQQEETPVEETEEKGQEDPAEDEEAAPAGDEQEAEANFFAKYSIAPPPLINTAKCESPWEIAARFFVSEQASVYIFIYFQKWLTYGPPDYEEYELEMLSQFGIAA